MCCIDLACGLVHCNDCHVEPNTCSKTVSSGCTACVVYLIKKESSLSYT